MKNYEKIRLGLCCIFRQQPIKYKQITAKTLLRSPRALQLSLLSDICLHNIKSVKKSLHFVAENGIGAFRILSPLFPRYTHPQVAYSLDDLPAGELIHNVCAEIRKFRKAHDIRLSFHPDQFNVLSSNREEVIHNTIRELTYQSMLADLVEVEVINIHAGGVYGDKESALNRLQENIMRLPDALKKRLTLENDDVSYTPEDLLPLCEKIQIPMVYDVHHHRCLPDGMTEEEVTERTISLWHSLGREPYFHISSPKHGWHNNTLKPHADFLDPADFPSCWQGITATVDIEAKAKEIAVLQLQKDLGVSGI